MTADPSILVLAGRRSASLDPLAAAAGVTHKSLVPVAGEAMLGRVLRIVEEAFPGARLFVSVEDFAAVATEPTVARLHAAGRVEPMEARFNIVDSLIEASKATGFPLMITTADNVLMTPAVLREVAARGAQGSADVLLVMAERESIRAAHPDGQRRFYEFRDGGFSNCNLFWLASDRALRTAESFREGGQFAKHPARLLKAFGLLNLLRFRFGLTTLAGAFGHLSRRFGVEIEPMVVRDGRVAIDVDNERTLRVAEEILARETNA
jgi:GTP:adenosylcobinamide-phosphate guanylyltransferase